ncbi:hypothetical protein [Brevundimonas diminuta]|uniref:hypothetical protein n=1 Tax=Brevundimonas diminuta TaxID=293 RepID=UPI0028AD310F|nr:hypothetical protein [Brevundimonas diminuta]
MFELNHIIPASAVDAEEMRLREVLASAGYAVAKLTLTSLAQQVVAERVKAKVVDLSIPLIAAMHEGQSDGSVLVRFEFPTDDAQSLAKLWLPHTATLS